ncbi:hypothetical protein ACP4OV_023041 [Aristida adscensionis]
MVIKEQSVLDTVSVSVGRPERVYYVIHTTIRYEYAPKQQIVEPMAAPCKMARQSPDLPDEVIEDIFARMPTKSVLRCRCLSRAWAAALSSNAFLDTHLDLANRRRRHGDEAPSLCSLPASPAASTVYAWSPPPAPPPEAGGKKAAGAFAPLMHVPHNARNGALMALTRSCRGLVLLRAIDARLYFLCNPSAGEIAALPDGRMAGVRRPRSDYASFGLGYDARARRHKVVRLLYHDERPAACDVYDVGAGAAGRWRPAAGGALPPERVRMNLCGVFVQGRVHWITMRGDGEAEAIVSFSVADEEFGYVAPPPPDGAVENALLMGRLTELAGCLCLVSAPDNPKSPTKCIDIWLLTDYATGTWGTHWQIDPTKLPPAPEVVDGFFFNDVIPIALDDGGGRVFFASGESQVAAYCLATGTLEELVPAGHRGARRQHLVPYEESLVSVGRPFEDVLFSPPAAQALSMALRRMPARALGRLKLVCRSWRATIESDRFAAWHNAQARAAAAAAAATLPISVVFVDPLYEVTPVPMEACSGEPDGARRRKPPLSTTRVVCRKACHGFLLLSSPNREWHVLFNPVMVVSRHFSLLGDGGHGCAGLGYDESREEHVLVQLCYTRRCFDTRSYAMACGVWWLRDLEPRRPAASSLPPIPVDVDVPPVFVGGKMYWPGEPRLGNAAAQAAILAFDIGAEAFEIVPAPPVPMNVDGGDRMVLTELSGKLCAAHSAGNTAGTMTIWGKNEEGWTREHVVDLEQWPEFWPGSVAPVIPMAVFPGDGRILLDTGKAVGYYDTGSQTLEIVYSLKEHICELHKLGELWEPIKLCCAEDMFVVAAIGEDSLLRPYDRKNWLW